MTGELAALAAASLWACTTLAIESAARRIGSLSVNLIRLTFALAFLSLAGLAFRGLPFPSDATPHNWLWLTASGLVGFTFGDLCLYRAYLVLGPRLSSVMMALVPPITALIGWVLLGETLSSRDLLGMALTVAGISWAILERGGRSGTVHARPVTPWGITLGIGAAFGQGLGLILSKVGMAGYDAFAATQVRVMAGLAGYALLFFPLRWWANVWTSLGDRKALGFSALGGFFGPFLAVSLSLIAIRETVAGVAASIMALTPILLIPLVVILRRERVGLAGVAAALIAVTGVALLFL